MLLGDMGVDVLPERFRLGVVDGLDVGYERISAINPRIVYCSISGYGQDGPYRELVGHDIKAGGRRGDRV